MFTAITTRGFLPLFIEKMVRLEESRSVVFSVSAAVPAPQQLREGEVRRTRDAWAWISQIKVTAYICSLLFHFSLPHMTINSILNMSHADYPLNWCRPTHYILGEM
jgi:hypothetical protein